MQCRSNPSRLVRAFFCLVGSGALVACSGMSAQQQYDLAFAQLQQRQAMIKPVLSLDCGDKQCQFERLEVHSEIVQQQAVAQQIQLPETAWQTTVKELGLTGRSLIGAGSQLAGQAAPLYFMADVARAGINKAGDVIDSTHDPLVVNQPAPVVVTAPDPVVVTAPDPVVVQQ